MGQLESVVNKILFLKKKRLFQFRGVEFFPAEVHLMLVIGEPVSLALSDHRIRLDPEEIWICTRYEPNRAID